MTLTRLEAEESKEMEGLRVHADALLSLSSSPSSTTTSSSSISRRAMAAEGVFECKTCRKRFASFQALGGHRTSHTRLQARMLSDPAGGGAAAERDKARVHECAVCGLEFSMGQALGGHMRRHRGEAPPTMAVAAQPGDDLEAMPDLNFPPLEDGGGSHGQEHRQEEPSGGDDDHNSSSSAEPQLLNLLV
ncbi:hypothetical protein PR202_gb04268 [Eleusine coracana subsp. coracana]|uniref:C2H2-type domain-containing protein n=1 Tax=Eleusine coracana subsp. coracana TaxID=191504 RepID=A0AAV5E485_ELECO|nr:hypothetical protein QOZ80_1BG0089310 [Eleusine coracana subsp. coracana]GJN17217.1 hypothetical protein PR202_gb04268 [Eleusine coracana subsp. coracana]